MTVSIKVRVPAKFAKNLQTTQYIATGVIAIIDKFTAANISAINIRVSDREVI
jgi:hypothetical protein